MSSRGLGPARRAAGAALAALLLSSATAAALPVNRTFGAIPGTSAFVYEDSENRAGAPLIRLYFIPTRSQVEDFTFNVKDDASVVASFSLSLHMSKALEENVALLKKQVMAVYGSSADRVQVLPLPLFESQTVFEKTEGLHIEAIVPDADTPVDGQLHFEIHFTERGWTQFKNRIVVSMGQLATYRGKAHLLDPATETTRDISVSVPLKLGNLPLCRVVVGGC
ncbi:hypothetical protein [Sorangium sp. So ce542]|uniref:hypothetical protein n=1 Tax=Sorangium sp. So ce542 TaxID=3133316 RepID=UPI003F5FA2F6